jgi:RNA polymerase sigma-70 factor (ECF subfamily)
LDVKERARPAVRATANDQAVPNPGTDLPRADFQSVYNTWLGDVSRWIHALGGPEADRDDIVQEVFIVVRRRLRDFRGDNVAGWLYRITRRQVRDFRRRVWFKHIFSRRRVVDLERIASRGTGPAAALEEKERLRILHALLERMQDDRRSALILFEIEGLSGEEIARIQDIPLATVWTRLHQARKELLALAQKLRRNQFEESA